MAGLVILDPKTRQYSAETRAAFGLQGGVRGRIIAGLGYKAQAMLLTPVQWTGGGLFCGTGGCDVGFSSGSSIIQLALDAGLSLRF